jgi:hypothetical protein
VFSFLSWGLLAIDGVLGLLVLRGRWREAMTLERENPRQGPLGLPDRWRNFPRTRDYASRGGLPDKGGPGCAARGDQRRIGLLL